MQNELASRFGRQAKPVLLILHFKVISKKPLIFYKFMLKAYSTKEQVCLMIRM